MSVFGVSVCAKAAVVSSAGGEKTRRGIVSANANEAGMTSSNLRRTPVPTEGVHCEWLKSHERHLAGPAIRVARTPPAAVVYDSGGDGAGARDRLGHHHFQRDRQRAAESLSLRGRETGRAGVYPRCEGER